MAKINNKLKYPIVGTPSLLDYFIGSLALDGSTVNFSIQSILELIGGISGDSINYAFSDGTDPDIDYTTSGALFTDTNDGQIGSFDKLIFSKNTLSEFNLQQLFAFLGGRDDITIKLQDVTNANVFFVFRITAFDEQADYVVFDVVPQSNLYTSELINNTVYNIQWDVLYGTLFTENIPVVLSNNKFFGKYPNGSVISAIGKTAQEVLIDIAAEYIKPSYNSITLTAIPNSNPIEVGEILNGLSTIFSLNNDSLGNPPLARFITGDGYNRSIMAETSPFLGTAPSTSNVATTKNWVLSGTDKDGTPIGSVSTSRTWFWRHFFGASNVVLTAASTPAQVSAVINALQQSILTGGKAANYTAGAYNDTVGNFTYIAYASPYGNLSNIIMNGALSVLSAFTNIGSFSYTNSKGVVLNMTVYKSNSDKAFASGTTLAIT